ncbi:hypothetical protein [Endozoicomonas atrinae]|uniref:hypothetical protein n=1 Tax=Endozoicomonas atrinae TaxID=1333660 RepID=UPI000B05B232|nr:hypothetical protein [Endozoicomonas atrinae]
MKTLYDESVAINDIAARSMIRLVCQLAVFTSRAVNTTTTSTTHHCFVATHFALQWS